MIIEALIVLLAKIRSQTKKTTHIIVFGILYTFFHLLRLINDGEKTVWARVQRMKTDYIWYNSLEYTYRLMKFWIVVIYVIYDYDYNNVLNSEKAHLANYNKSGCAV